MSAARNFSARTFAALKVRNFRLYFIGQLISFSGSWMQSVAQGWLVLKLTGSSVDLGFAIALQYVPMLVIGSYGGVVADRHFKRPILYATQTAAGLLALTLGVLVSIHHVNVLTVYLIAFGLGIVNLFDVPARQAFVQEMVGRDLIANAVSLNGVLMNSGRVIGPAVAAATIAIFGIATCFYANAISYVAVLVALAMMRAKDFNPLRTVTREKGQMLKGIKYVASTLLLRNTIVAVALIGLFAFNFTVTLPLLATQTFHDHSATGYGALMGAMGLGAVIGGLYVLATAFGVLMAIVAVSPSLLIAEISMVPMGAFSIAFVSTANATLQLNSSEEMRGRVMSLHGTAFLGTTPIGAPLVGLIVGLTNPRIGMGCGAVVTLLAGLWLFIQLPASRKSHKELREAR